MQPSWDEILKMIARRMREADDADTPIPGVIPAVGEVDIPYYNITIIENTLLEVSNDLLREVDDELIQGVSSDAVITQITGSPWTYPLNTIRILSVSIQPVSGNYVASQPLPPASYFQNKYLDPKYGVFWTIYQGSVNFTGASATVVYLMEPDIVLWRTSTSILPDGYTTKQVDGVMKRLKIMNFE